MSTNKKLAALAAGFAILLSPIAGATAETRTHHRPHYRDHNRDYRQRSAGCPVHTNAFGELVDCRGWRKWSGSVGWDNTCFKSLDYLPGQYACTGNAPDGS